MVLQTEMRSLVGQAEQHVVVPVVCGTGEAQDLGGQIAHLCLLRAADLGRLLVVRKYVEMHRSFRTRIEVDAIEVLAAEQRRIDQRLQAHRAVRARLALERGHAVPAGRRLDRGLHRDGIGALASGVPQHLVPFQLGQIGRG